MPLMFPLRAVPAIVLMALTAGAWAESTTAPASQPADERVLVRLGDRAVITQADYNRAMYGREPEWVEKNRDHVIRRLVDVKLFELYVDDHPELVDYEALEGKKRRVFEEQEVAGEAEFNEKFKASGISFADIWRDWKLYLARRALILKAQKAFPDEASLRRLYAERPAEFNDSRMKLRLIEFRTQPYHTPEQKAERRGALEALRAKLLSGEVTWEEAVEQSDNPNKIIKGNMGFVPRHLEQPEALAEAAFKLSEVGEISPVFETANSYNIVQLIEKHDGIKPFEKARGDIRRWVNLEPVFEVDQQARQRYPVIGVQPPEMPPAELLAPQAKLPGRNQNINFMRMLAPPRPTTRPAGQTQQNESSTTQPADSSENTQPAGHTEQPAPQPADQSG